nr:BON domain-containing protein [Nitrospirales bacterium]
MTSPFKHFLVWLTFSLFIAAMMENADGQILYVPVPGFDEALSPGEYDPLAGDDIPKEVLSDGKLENRIKRQLDRSPFVNGNITVQVDDGTAVLSGSVENRDAMAIAVEIAYDAGATNVHNHLHLRDHLDRPWTKMTDRELKEAVEDELYWSPFVNSVPIRVQAQNGIVTLSGR